MNALKAMFYLFAIVCVLGFFLGIGAGVAIKIASFILAL